MKTLATLAVATVLVTGCQTESVPEPSTEATPVAFNREGAPTTEILVPGMMCQFACPPAVKKVLTAQTGVKDVKVDFESKTATVAIDVTKFNGEAAIAALVDYDFGNAKLVVAE